MTPMVVRGLAWADVDEIDAWYESQKTGLGNRFRDALDDALIRIRTYPKMYAVSFRGIRKGRIDGFPDYLIIYRIRNFGIEVLSVVSGRRSPSAWISRIDP